MSPEVVALCSMIAFANASSLPLVARLRGRALGRRARAFGRRERALRRRLGRYSRCRSWAVCDRYQMMIVAIGWRAHDRLEPVRRRKL